MTNTTAEHRTALRLQCALCEQDVVVLKAWYERTKTVAAAAAASDAATTAKLAAMRAQLEDKVRERKQLIGELQLANANIDALTEAREHYAFAAQEQDRLSQEHTRVLDFALSKFGAATTTEARELSADEAQVQQVTRRLGLDDSVDFAGFACTVKALDRLEDHHFPKWLKAYDKAAVDETVEATKRRWDVGQAELEVVGGHFQIPPEILAHVAAELPKPPTIETKFNNVKERTTLEERLKGLVRERKAANDCNDKGGLYKILDIGIKH
ncbi:hypothetical protein HDU87_004327 [Geranomyces variabilis]|uniref:Uncharacterized protein n=1 Tax=Geranomyces variabilis TaxID=109894 RepID=A0AAD5TJH5_9FUNG|nr:hypothetical protein HDU87_004327 [Geranomyces variabilis]